MASLVAVATARWRGRVAVVVVMRYLSRDNPGEEEMKPSLDDRSGVRSGVGVVLGDLSPLVLGVGHSGDELLLVSTTLSPETVRVVRFTPVMFNSMPLHRYYLEFISIEPVR